MKRFLAETDRLILKTLDEKDASSLFIYFSKNRSFLEKWESDRAPLFYSSAYMKHWIRKDNQQMLDDELLRLWIYEKHNFNDIIGSVGIWNIETAIKSSTELNEMSPNSSFKKATLGYRLDKDLCNRGYITEGIAKMIEISFNDLGIDKLEAEVMTTNISSIRVLEKCNFKREQTIYNHMEIGGELRDYFVYGIWSSYECSR